MIQHLSAFPTKNKKRNNNNKKPQTETSTNHIFPIPSAPLFKKHLFSLDTGSRLRNRQVLSSTIISHTCVQAVGTSPSGSDQKQQAAPVPTGQQHRFGSAKATANTGNLWVLGAGLLLGLHLCAPGRAMSQACQERLEQHRGFCTQVKSGSTRNPDTKSWERGLLVRTSKADSKALTLPPWAARAPGERVPC